MLIEFSVKNFKSIKEQQTLSMAATSGSELLESNIIRSLDNKLNLVRTAAIYGPNASGKTNLIKALEAMQIIILTSSKKQLGDLLEVTPYLFSQETQKSPSEFSISFIVQNIRYQYGFIATKEQVLEEWLFAYPKGRPQEWINRKYVIDAQKYEWGNMDKLVGPKQIWQEATRPNALFLPTAVQLNNKQLQPIFDWFRLILRTVSGNLSNNFTFRQCDDNNLKQEIIHFLQAADFNINDLEVKSEQIELNDFLGNLFPDQSSIKITTDAVTNSKEKPDIWKPDIKTTHIGEDGDKYKLDMRDESTGTQKYFAYSGPWLDVLKKGYILVVDELNNNLHPDLVKFMIQMFQNNNLNRKNAQLIFTTHETSVLNQEIFRRDQIWFTEKDEYNATKLFPLSDFSPRKNAENFGRNYLNGRYGALPYIQNVANIFGVEE